MSVPIARVVIPAATDAEAPPEDPPGVRAGSQGLRVIPDKRLSVRPKHGQFRCRGLANDDGAGSAQPFHTDVVAVGYVLPEQQAAPSSGQTGDKDVVFH